MNAELERFSLFAVDLVGRAGKVAEQEREIEKVKDNDDLVTRGDLLAEKTVLGAIGESFPGHGYISEEKGENNAGADYVWILDPIDGTKYFARGVPFYSVSLALSRRGEIVLGAVNFPGLGSVYSAVKGGGARLNGSPIGCSTVEKLEDAVVCLEIPSRNSDEKKRVRASRIMAALVERTMRVRILGVSSLGLCLCASAGFDIYINMNDGSKVWDLAGGRIVAEEAGAVYSEKGDVKIAAPPALFDKLIQANWFDLSSR